MFDSFSKDPGLIDIKAVFSKQLTEGLWWLTPKLNFNPAQWKKAAEFSSKIFSTPVPQYAKSLLFREWSAVYRKSKAITQPFNCFSSKDKTVLCFPIVFSGNIAGYLVVSDIFADQADEIFTSLSFSWNLLVDNFFKASELSRLSETIRPRAIALSTVHTVHRIINSTLNLDELVSRLAHLTAQVLRTSQCSLFLYDKKNGHAERLVCKALVGFPKKNGADGLKNTAPSALEIRVAKFADIQLRKKILCIPLIDEDVIGVVTISGKKDKKDFNRFDLEILTTLAEEAVIAIKNAQLYEEQRRVTLDTIQSLAVVLGSRMSQESLISPEVFAHIALKTAEALGLSDEQKQALHYAALLKETTKIGIPDEILKNPSKLTNDQLKEIREHPAYGAKIVQKFENLKTVAPIILYSREKFDGTGYPEGLKGESIPVGARVLSVMNAFEAIVVGRPWRGRLSQAGAFMELEKNSGTQFDPRVVEAFIKVVKKESLYKRIASH